MITIQELLINRGLNQESKIKLVRHKDNRCDLYNKYRKDKEWFYKYQSSQAKPVFKDTDYIVSFIGEEGLSSRFIGVFKVNGVEEKNTYNTDDLTDGNYIYNLEKIENVYEDLTERVIIKWSNPISWHQWITTKEMEVIEIQPGLHYKQFNDYYDFILNFDELKEIVDNQYKDWKRMLSATKGIYLIHDTNTGKLYVGSAYGEEGIWGRWSDYVKTNGSGGNKMLVELINNDHTYAKNFQFSILMLLPKTITNDEAINKERLFKNKLGTNTFGLNCN